MPNEDNAQLQDMAQKFLISEDWAELDISEIDSFQAIVELFDKGYQSIFFSENGVFKGSLSINLLRNSPKCKNEMYKHTFQLEEIGVIHSDEAADRLAAARMRNKYPWCEEFPVIDDKNKILQVMSCPSIFDDYRKKEHVELQKVEWQLVSQEVAKEFFGHKKILISSQCGDMEGFWETFHDCLDITVYTDKRYSLYKQQQYEILLCASTFFNDDYCKRRYVARNLYADLLAESLVRYLKSNGVEYHYYDLKKPLLDIDRRVTNGLAIGFPNSIKYRHSYHGYFFSTNSRYERYDGNVGERPTKALENYKHRIFIFGGCIVYSVFSVFKETIASKLQEIIDTHNRGYRVINCGALPTGSPLFADINNMYRIMDMALSPGDIIVQFGRSLWSNATFDFGNRHYVCDIFTSAETKDLSCFCVPPNPPLISHLDSNGNECVASKIYEHTLDCIPLEVSNSDCVVKSYFSKYSKYQSDIDESIKDLQLNIYSRTGRNGFISLINVVTTKSVMLINQALTNVGYLFIRISKKDTSYMEMWLKQQGIRDKVCLLPEKMVKKKFYLWGVPFHSQEEDYCCLDDLYIFLYRIAPILNVETYFIYGNYFVEHREFLHLQKDYIERSGINVIVL